MTPSSPASVMPGFLLLTLTAGLGVGAAKIVTTLHAVALGAGPIEIGVITGIQSLGLLLISLPVGLIVEQAGPRRLFMLGSVIGGAAYLATSLAHETGLLILCVALAGFAMPFRFVSLNTVFLGHIMQLGQAKAGWFRGAHMMGVFLLGPVVGGAMIAALGFDHTWWAVAAMFFICAPLALLGLTPAPEAAPHPPQPGSMLSQLRGLLSAPGMADAAANDLIAQAALMHFSAFIVPLAIRGFNVAETTAAQMVSAQGIAFVAALFLLGGPAQSLNGGRGLGLAALIAALGETLVATAQHPAALWIGAGLIGFGLGLLQVVNLARFAQLSAELGRGRVAGVVALTGPLGGFLGAVGGGVLGRAVGPQYAFAAFIPILLLTAVAAVRPPSRTAPRPLAQTE